ncbi:unnamed protein product [Brassica oleracea]
MSVHHTPSGPPCLSSGGPRSIIGVSTAGGKTRSQEEWVWWACRMVSCDPVPGRQRLVQICRRRFYLRGVEASTAPPSSVKFSGCEGMFFLTSPAVVVRYLGLWFLYVCELFGSRLSGYNWILDLNRMRNR